MAKRKEVTEEQLLKALGELEGNVEDDEEIAKAASADEESSEDESSDDEESSEEPTKKSEPKMPANTKEANGGLTQKDSDDAEDFETAADRKDPSGGSMKSLVSQNSDIQKGFNVSNFLEALVDSNVQSVDSLAKSQADFQNEQREFNAKLQKAVIAIGNNMMSMQKSQADSDDEPVARPRSIVRKSEVVERFGTPADEAQFSQAQTLNVITEMAIKGELPPTAVSAYESSNFVDASHVSLVNNRLKQTYR